MSIGCAYLHATAQKYDLAQPEVSQYVIFGVDFVLFVLRYRQCEGLKVWNKQNAGSTLFLCCGLNVQVIHPNVITIPSNAMG